MTTAAERMPRRAVLLLLAVVFTAAALLVSRRPEWPLPGAAAWAARHPDPRVVDAGAEASLALQLDGARRDDLLLLFAALAAGCLVVAVSPRVAAWTGGAPSAVLLCGSIGLGLSQLALSIAGQAQGLADGSWSVADDTLDRIAPAEAATLREWRARIAPDEGVILIGSDPRLYDLVVWALPPRPLYPMLLDIQPATSEEKVLRGARGLAVVRERGARWIVDLNVLSRAAPAGHPALMRVEP